jgi:hypothetical protein
MPKTEYPKQRFAIKRVRQVQKQQLAHTYNKTEEEQKSSDNITIHNNQQ